MIRMMLVPFLVAGLAGCQSAPQPAVLEPATPEARETLTRVLADAVGRARIELGPSDPAEVSVISVLPPSLGPHEDRSPVMPVLFELVTTPEGCFARAQADGEMYLLPGVTCRPVK